MQPSPCLLSCQGGVVLVNNKPASVVAVTLADAVGAWLASPQRAATDLGGAIADVKADVYAEKRR